MTDLLQFLLMLTALFLLLAAAGALLELIEVLRSRESLPAPDDPRLRNIVGIREWRERKQKIRGKWVS